MAKPVKQLAAASLSLKEAMSCRLISSGGGGHAQRFGSFLPCRRTRMPTPVRGTTSSSSSSTRPAPVVNNRVINVEKPLEVAQERADKQPTKTCTDKQPTKTFGPGRSKQHDKGASETTIRQQLQQVDVLENMGISRHFAIEIKRILDRTYRCWLQRDDEIMLDTATCAMTFRILRMNGYDVSSDELYHAFEASGFHNSLGGYLNDIRTLLELHKVSTVCISEDESILDSIGSWSGTILREQLGSGGALRTPLFREVEHALDCPFYTTLDRLDHRWYIENFNATGHLMLETPYLSSRHTSRDILALAIRDFSSSQFTYQQELQHLESWVKECRLDRLPFARQKLAYFYLSAAGTMFLPELSDARILWAKNGVLTTIVDDFFDVGGSKEELKNLVMLVEMWDEHHKIEFYSEHVEIVFSSIYNSVNQLGAKASMLQNRNVTKHLVEIWLDLLKSMMTEVEWRMNKYVPTEEEYMQNASLTFALGPIVLPALYFVGPKISESVVKDPEYNELFRLMSTCGRLLNDVQTFEVHCWVLTLNFIGKLVNPHNQLGAKGKPCILKI